MEKRTKYKTYTHLGQKRKMPSDYEIVTTQLDYYNRKGFEVKTEIASWYEKYQTNSHLKSGKAPSEQEHFFHDPKSTTYSKYVERQKNKENFVRDLLHSASEKNHGHYDQNLDHKWKKNLVETLGVMRFPCHALQMMAAYGAQMATSSRITIMMMFQSADEMRRIQCFAYRLGQLRQSDPDLFCDFRQKWENEEKWQQLRQWTEKSFIIYDWTESLVVLNDFLKPFIDHKIYSNLYIQAKDAGDYLWCEILDSLKEDAKWHQDCWQELQSFLIKENSDYERILAEYRNVHQKSGN